MTLFFILLTSISLTLANDFTFNQESGKAIPKHIGELKLFRGRVFKQNSNGVTPIALGEKIYKKDNLVTEEKSFAKILMVDDSVFNIGPKSQIKFEEFDYKDKSDRKMIFELVAGQIRGLIKNKAKDGDLTIKTKLATMGVRGTELLVNHQNLKDVKVSEFGLIEGNVQLANKKNELFDLKKSDRMIFVESNEGTQGNQEKNSLTETELATLKNDDEFMALFIPEKLEPTSILQPFFTPKNTTPAPSPSSSAMSDTLNDAKDDWRSNLKKLNDKLRENHKKNTR